MAYPVTEGEVDFDAPNAGKPAKTWYRIIGNLDSSSIPIITLHGGPGGGHNYMKSLSDLYEKYGIPVILYDQIGCGNSTRFSDRVGDTAFWNFELFFQELDNLIDHLKLRENGFHLLGQSWGGMFGGAYACRRPRGLKKLVLASGPGDVPLFMAGLKKLVSQLPPDVRKTIEDCEARGDYESEEYEKAGMVFYARHVCRLDPFPEDVLATFGNLTEDKACYMTIQGPSEFTVIGSMKDWVPAKDAHNIEVETLLINGRYDEVTDSCVAPWFKNIPKVKWVTLENSSHMAHWEERDRFMQVCADFLLPDGTSSS
ncbi:Alpha/Beta hydrolase protein [Mariannaea sp. PMI_226]|nr:Alpha/Beta hydrolase protein [Mariannaea sp. PMI_226]